MTAIRKDDPWEATVSSFPQKGPLSQVQEENLPPYPEAGWVISSLCLTYPVRLSDR